MNLNSDKDYDIITFISEQIRSNFLFQSCDHSTIVNLARQFIVCEYDPGFAIIEQGDTLDDSRICDMCYYILVEGECIVVKDGKTVHDVHGRIHAKGSTFGENGLLFGSRSASIVASPKTKKTVLYCLDSKIFREFVGDDEITKLQEKIKRIQSVLDTLSGADTKMRKGTIIKQYKPESVRVC